MSLWIIKFYIQQAGKENNMELNNKKIAFLGDSITEGYGVSNPDNFFWNRIARQSGALCYGYGIGGTRIAPQSTPSDEAAHDQSFVTRVEGMIPDADVVVVFGGTNDFGHGDAPLGSISDRTEHSFCGAFHVLLQKLITRYPEAQLVVMTPLHRESEDHLGVNEIGIRREFPLESYVDAIISISGYYGVPVLDLYRVSGLQPAVPLLKELYMPDGLHPNDQGHKRIAEKLLGFLRML